jgi:hypothetical protein
MFLCVYIRKYFEQLSIIAYQDLVTITPRLSGLVEPHPHYSCNSVSRVPSWILGSSIQDADSRPDDSELLDSIKPQKNAELSMV